MGKASAFSAARISELEASAEEQWSREAFLRFQGLWLRHSLGLSAPKIARALQISVASVRQIHADFIKTRRPAIEGKGSRGGRRKRLMSMDEEASFLRDHARQ